MNEKFKKCSVEDQELVLNYLSTGKSVIPYKMITRFDSLDIAPENYTFFLPHHFYSGMKDALISKEDYEPVERLYRTLKLENLVELNKLYSFQDTIILCEIFKQRSAHLQKMFKFNPKKCNSASSFSGCVHRNKSKCSIALPTHAEQVKLFEKTLVGCFSCVNTRLAFDTQILLPKNEKDHYKLIYDVKIKNMKQKKQISTKILKMDENNQYGNAMIKMYKGCIKQGEKFHLYMCLTEH